MASSFLLLKPALVLVASAAWWRERKRFAPRSWALGVQLIAGCIAESYGCYLSLSEQRNLWWYDLYAPVELGLLLLYAHAHFRHRWQRLVLLPTAAGLAVIYTLDMRASYPLGFVSAAYICGALVLVGAYMSLVYELALRVDRVLYRQPLFWVHLGVAFFFAGMVPLLGLWNQLTEGDIGLARRLFIANDVLFTLRYGSVILACAIPFRQHAATA